MANLIVDGIFSQFQDHITNEQAVRDEIRLIMKDVESASKQATQSLQVIHTSLTEVSDACQTARKHFAECREGFQKLAAIIPQNQFYRYHDHWVYTTQSIVCSIALTVFLEIGALVSRETVAEILGLRCQQSEGFHLDIEDYLMGVLRLAAELSRFAVNAVILGEFSRPLQISKFVSDINAGFRLLNLKNDGLRKRFDGLKYDVKKIEEIVYDLSIRGLNPTAGAAAVAAIPAQD